MGEGRHPGSILALLTLIRSMGLNRPSALLLSWLMRKSTKYYIIAIVFFFLLFLFKSEPILNSIVRYNDCRETLARSSNRPGIASNLFALGIPHRLIPDYEGTVPVWLTCLTYTRILF